MGYTQVNVTNVTRSAPRYDGQGTAGESGGSGTGLKFSNDGKVFLLLENTAANTPIVNIESGGTIDGLDIADIAITMVASQNRIVGPFPVGTFNQPSSTFVQINFSGGNETDVEVFPMKLS